MEPLNQDKLVCVQLSSASSLAAGQYCDIARLIYDTDPYIYPALFGGGPEGMENALRLLPDLFISGRDAMFTKNNLFLLCNAEQIAGLILWHRGRMVWDPHELLAAAGRRQIRLDTCHVLLVGKEYIDSRYSGGEPAREEAISLINVCVRKEARGCGAAKHMMERFIRMHGGKRMELAVLADNLPAIGLYKKFGFHVVQETEGFSLGAQKPLCLIMERDD